MKDKLLTLKSTENRSMMQDVWWKYNWSADNQLPDAMIRKLSESLDMFIDIVYQDYELYTEEKLAMHIKAQVRELCKICPQLLQDNLGLYDYGGLNDYFINVIECFPFYIKDKYRNNNECLYDCINGKPFNDSGE